MCSESQESLNNPCQIFLIGIYQKLASRDLSHFIGKLNYCSQKWDVFAGNHKILHLSYVFADIAKRLCELGDFDVTGLTLSEPVNRSLEEFINLTVDTYVNSWYSEISHDQAFLMEIRYWVAIHFEVGFLFFYIQFFQVNTYTV